MAQQKTSLSRTLRVGEAVSFDNGRIVVKLVDKSGRKAGLHLLIDPDIKVDRPPKPPK